MNRHILGLTVGATIVLGVLAPQLVFAAPADHNSRAGSSNCNPNLPIATPQPPRPCR